MFTSLKEITLYKKPCKTRKLKTNVNRVGPVTIHHLIMCTMINDMCLGGGGIPLLLQIWDRMSEIEKYY